MRHPQPGGPSPAEVLRINSTYRIRAEWGQSKDSPVATLATSEAGGVKRGP